ncbi:MAG TPA: Type 1 glutamine amidotransferase-like domain-containing protein [Pyrinomonadaceae bacterium]|nr:Type 1 glutamine amidotransferase-like domain-containing protein [Pyrinomonadaceae bacterium]
MSSSLKPIYLLADSQLLFWREDGILFLDSVKDLIANQPARAAYIGASNGDHRDYYSIFETAMANIGIDHCRMIPSAFSTDDAEFLNQADVILLAGGDVERGWNIIKQNGVVEAVIERYYKGAILMGVSAGAVQLGLFGWPESPPTLDNLIDTFKLVPFIVSAHDEARQWQQLQEAILLLGGSLQGLGIPTGGGLRYHPDRTIEPIRFSVYEVSVRAGSIVQTLLVPGNGDDIETTALVC